MHPIPEKLARTALDLHGEAGAAWLRRLPDLLADCAARWSLTLGPPFPGLTYHYVAPAIGPDGSPLVLKAGVPSRGLFAEIAALRHYDGSGAARLLDADEERGVMLLERLEPGTSLVGSADDAAATRIAASVMRRLWKPAPEQPAFPTVADWGRGFARLRARFDGGPGPFPPVLLAEAETLFRDLTASQAAPILLHGDLHHGNILSAGRETWLAIDPQGVLGEPAYEVGAFLRNPSPRPASVLARRLDIFTDELGIDRARLRGWGLAQAVLSAWWTLEDHGYVGEEAISVASVLAALPE
ncbi:MAG: phosphotransferase [Armatimonadetes bacterium]|nr:phosphotransferase [Armatimonadota bacterium]